jgi:hypothetical protein
MSKNFKYIKQIPFWWKYTPFLSLDMARTIYPYIYFPKDIFLNLKEVNPEDTNFSIYVHEKVHIDRQESFGILKWNLYYLLFRKFRLEEEVIAIREQMRFLKSKSLSYDFERKARQFDSATYLWLISYDKALSILNKIWSEVDSSDNHSVIKQEV